MPEVHIDEQSLDVVDEVKLLGLVITSDLKWTKNTESICKKGYSRLWMLRRLKALGADKDDLKEVYEKQVRSILEFGIPVFTAGLTVDDSNNIERVQRTAAYIILDEDYTSYGDALAVLDLEPLWERRIGICTNFAQKAIKSEKFSNWFNVNEVKETKNDRKCKEIVTEPILKPVTSRTKRRYPGWFFVIGDLVAPLNLLKTLSSNFPGYVLFNSLIGV